MAAQHRTGESGSRVLHGRSTPTERGVLGVLGGDVGHHCGPVAAGIQARGELSEQGGGQVQFDDSTPTRRQVADARLSCSVLSSVSQLARASRSAII